MTERPSLGWSVAVVVGLGALGLVAFVPAAYGWWAAHVTTAISRAVLQIVFAGAVLTHMAEAFYAMHLVRRLGLETETNRWFWQTVLLGYPSLGILMRRARARQ
jgi:hypothetical protein